ncbi:uncharacterized protein LOC105285461 [Ooceraea biroi]|nr:uncharacterized protein LOC105285461 [Ooceraea biroi]EZA48569.1 hypothetical protein X777_13240 [Ooceraea biroi]
MNAAASQTAQYSMRQAESAVAQPTEEPMPATLMPTSSGIDSSTDAPGQEIIEEAIGGLFAIELDEPETMPTTVTVESNNLMPLLKIISTSPAQEAAAKREAAGKLVMDMAGADRNGPYFFYLRTEPDIDIAIEHNDEKVIPDPGRERISANRKYLYFNLRDEQR